MNRRWLMAGGVAAFLLGLLAYMPAAWVAQSANALIPAVRLAGVDGTAWSGRAQYLVADGVVLQDVRWRLRPGALAADLVVATDDGRLRATVRPGPGGGVRVTGAEGRASLAWFGRLAGYLQLPISGGVEAAIEEAVITGDMHVTHIDGRVLLSGARWQLAKPPIVLGGFGGVLTTENDTLALKVVESDGPLAVDGTAQLIGGDRYQLDLRLRPRGGADERLESTLRLLGRPDAEGRYRIREHGRF